MFSNIFKALGLIAGLAVSVFILLAFAYFSYMLVIVGVLWMIGYGAYVALKSYQPIESELDL